MRTFPWLSVLLLLLANVAFGFFLHDHDGVRQGQAELVWASAIAYIVFECSVLSIAWKSTQRFMLLGFKSDVGYALMAVGGASLAVIVLVWIQIFSHFLVMLAAAILLRIKLYTWRSGKVMCFLTMTAISFAGLAMSWLPTLIKTGQITIL